MQDASVQDAQSGVNDATTPATQDSAVMPSMLCDGNAAMRAGLAVQGGGPLAPMFAFTNPYGHSFVFIDGHCHYYAGSDYMDGIAEGTLSDAEAKQLSTEMGWPMLQSWHAHNDDACPDAAATLLMRDGTSAFCSCGCDADAPTGLADAVQAGGRWMKDLAARGTPLTGPLVALAYAVQFADQKPITALPWPLNRSMASIVGLINAEGGTTTSARLEAAADVSALRALRANSTAQSMGLGFVRVADTNGGIYNLYVVDVLPDASTAAISDFEQRAQLP